MLAGNPPRITRRALMRTAALLTGGFVLSNVSACKKSESQGPSRRGVAAKPLDSEGRPQPSDQDRCAMCAMRVADHPEWIGAIELDDGTTFYFCSVRCTLGSALRAPEFLKSEASHIRRTRVPDYLVKDRWIDADSALFVVDSDVKGPMGLELVPVGRQDDADVVVRRHGGRVVRRAEVTIDLLRDLKARSAAPK